MAGRKRGFRRAVARALGPLLFCAVLCSALHPVMVRAQAAAASAAASAPPAVPVAEPALPAVPLVTPVEPAALPLPTGVRVIEIKGMIRRTLVAKLRAALRGVDHARFPAGALILLDSPGGDGLAALEAGRLVREAEAHVFVRSRCSSACVFILAAGVVRGVADGATVAIHRPRLTTFVKGLGVVDINTASNRNAEKAFALANRRTQDYLLEMGMPDALYEAMMAAPSEQMRHLGSVELEAFSLTGFEAGYRETRVAEGAQKYGITPQAFERRTLQMPRSCLTGESAPREIVRCYRRVLQAGT